MDEPDFSGIEPLRVPEALRRVAAITEYLALPDPRSVDVVRLAAGIGLNRGQFLRLVRVWRDHRDARLLVIGKRGAATRDYGVDPRATKIAAEVIDAAGAGATLATVAPEIEHRCAEEGVTPLARATINNHLRASRATAHVKMDGPSRIVVGRMWFYLPVTGMPAEAMPTLLAAVMLPERIVVAHAVSTDPASPPPVGALIDDLARLRTADATSRPLLLDPDDRRVAADALTRAGLGRTRSARRSVQRELSKAFSGRLGPLPVIHQRGMARPATKRVICRQDEALSPQRIVEVVNGAVDSHNAAMLTVTPAFDIAAH